MLSIAVLYHSGYGHTKRLAQAVVSGAQEAAEALRVVEVEIAQDGELSAEQWQSLDDAAAIIFGSPTYMGSVSWQFKKVADASSGRWLMQSWKDKLAAGFTNSASMNGDKASTLAYMNTFAMQHSMLWVGSGLLAANTKAAQRNDINYLGAFAGLMAQSPADASVDEGPLPGDMATAKLFAARVVEQCLRLQGVR
ncbi:flavodoxin family protein [Spongiibacter sp.]|uniref:flavodoxin family protein n=1 Tax=Spongiibacter sp. TaxID=2024860 RepID=UPI003562C1B6